MYMYICICVNTYTYICVYIYIYACIYIYVCNYIVSSPRSPLRGHKGWVHWKIWACNSTFWSMSAPKIHVRWFIKIITQNLFIFFCAVFNWGIQSTGEFFFFFIIHHFPHRALDHSKFEWSRARWGNSWIIKSPRTVCLHRR